MGAVEGMIEDTEEEREGGGKLKRFCEIPIALISYKSWRHFPRPVLASVTPPTPTLPPFLAFCCCRSPTFNLNWHSAIFHRFEEATVTLSLSLFLWPTPYPQSIIPPQPPLRLLGLRRGNLMSLRRNFPCTFKVLARHSPLDSRLRCCRLCLPSLSLFNGDDVPAQLGNKWRRRRRA